MDRERVVWVSEVEAQRLWRRAAEIQVEASRKVEERTRDLRGPSGLVALGGREHFTLDDVRGAAREAGIDESHLEAAVAELLDERAAGGVFEPDAIERMAARFFGSPPPALEATTVLAASPERVYAILQALLPSEPYRLRLRDAVGGDPVREGVLVFDAPGDAATRGSYARETLMAGDRIERLYVMLRAHRGDGGDACGITVRGRIRSDPEPAFWMGSAFTAAGAGAGGFAGAVIALGLGVAAPWAALPAIALAGLTGGVTYSALRSRYLAPLVRGARGLEELLEVITAAVKTDGAFLQRPRTDDREVRERTRPLG